MRQRKTAQVQDRAVFEFSKDYFQRVDIMKPTMAMPKPIRMFQF
jgi:hypothetical protein